MGGSLSVLLRDDSPTQRPKVYVARNSQRALPEVKKNEKGFIIPGIPPYPPIPNKHIAPVDLYNLITLGCPHPFLVVHSLIIDCRDLNSYKKLHIISAKHFSTLNENIVSSVCQNSKLQFVHIILYGSQKEHSHTEEFFNRIDKQGLKARILFGGFESFYNTAPFLCMTQTTENVNRRREKLANYPSVILEGRLYLGTCLHAKSRDVFHNLGITHVINITTDVPCSFERECKYLHLKYEDEQQSQLFPIFHEAADFVAKALSQGGVVFVHCVAGVSRSSTLVIVFLMKHFGLTFADAYTFVKKRREIIYPNRGFLKQMLKFEVMLFGEPFSESFNPMCS